MQRIESALRFVDSDDRDTWLRMGMAIKSELGEAGFDLWDTWSQSSSSYRRDSSRAVWRSIHPAGGITIASLFHEAKAAGWRDDGTYQKPTAQELAARKHRQELATQKRTAQEIREHAAAAKIAIGRLARCELDYHQYLAIKGWPKGIGNILKEDEAEPLLVIPMYYQDKICGCETISPSGEKLFLYGQRVLGSTFTIGTGGDTFLCEGYATGLSLKELLDAIAVKHTIKICFTAHNTCVIGQTIPHAIIIADNDEKKAGEKAAVNSGCRWWMPPTVGWDVNDLHRKEGKFRASQILKKALQSLRRKA